MSKKIRILSYLLSTGKFKDSNDLTKVIQDNRVRVGDRVVHSLNFEFRPSTETVFVDNHKVTPLEHSYYLFHKPIGIISQKNDAEGRLSVWDFLAKNAILPPAKVNALVTIGRLDIDTQGLLLITTDRNFVNKISNPSSKIEKEYYVVADGVVSDASLERLRSGVRLSVKVHNKRKTITTLPAQVRLLKRSSNKTELSIVITEGKKRQVRAMLFAVGHKVTFLQRTRIGHFLLGKIPVGQISPVSHADFMKLLR